MSICLNSCGRLRQRVELPVMDARRHEELARALGRGLVEHRRLDVDEAERVEVLARRHRGAVAQLEVLLHRGAAQVEHAMREPHGLREALLVERERRRGGSVQDLDLVREHLDLAGAQRGVGRALGPRAHPAGDGNAVFVAQLLGGRERLGAVRIGHDLQQALAVAQVDEDDAAVVAATMDPAGHGDRLVQVAAVDEAAVVGAFHESLQPDLMGSVRGGRGQAKRPGGMRRGARVSAVNLGS
jgi:hypothetical protein